VPALPQPANKSDRAAFPGRAAAHDERPRPTRTDVASIGIDIGKDVFHIVDFDPQGKVVLRKKCLALEAELAKLPPSIVWLDACLGSLYARAPTPCADRSSPSWAWRLTDCPTFLVVPLKI
jgi:hypothetical protein